MTMSIWMSFIGLVMLLMATPGPSQLLMLSNSIHSGFSKAIWTAYGDLSANVLQMLLAATGVATVVLHVEYGLAIIKWGGVGYLTYLGLSALWRSGATSQSANSDGNRSCIKLFTQGFVTSAANPKAIIFFAALFPQFILPIADFWHQFLILAVTYVFLDASVLFIYGALAGTLDRVLDSDRKSWLHKAGGVAMLCAALLLALKRIDGVA